MNNYDLDGVCQDCIYLEKIRPLFEEKDKETERLKQGYCELKEKCNRGECDCTYEEYNEMCKQNMKMDLEIERLNNDIKILLKENEIKEKVIVKYDNFINDLYNGLEQIIEQGYDYSEKDFIASKLQDKLQELKGDSSNE